MKAWKFLRSGARSLFQATVWPLPAAHGPGVWLEASPGPLAACRNGLHACRTEDLAHWLSDELWEVELDSEWISVPDAVVARRARLLRRIDGWETGSIRAEFSERCVARAHAAAAREAAAPGALQYLEQAESFARDGHTAVAAYAAALVCGALVPVEAAMASFRAERCEQGQLLAAVLGLR